MKEAEKKLAESRSFLRSLFGGGSKREEAVECYLKAGNLFKMAKNWARAGWAFREAAKMQMGHEAASSYTDAASCYKKCDTPEALSCYLKAIDLYTDLGRFVTAAKLHQKIAESYESDNDPETADRHYEKAADYFAGEDNQTSALRCLLKVADHSALSGDYDKAVPIYQQAAKLTLNSPLTKYSTREHVFKEVVCRLCVDVSEAQEALERYERTCPAFGGSREDGLLRALVVSVEEGDEEGFGEAVARYDEASRLNGWTTTMLLRVKGRVGAKRSLR